MKKLTTLVATSLLCVSSMAMADRGLAEKYPGYSHQHDRFEYARVLDVTPIYREVRVTEPVKECWTETVTRDRHHDHPSANGMLAGGIVGGIIGHHLGKNRRNRGLTTAVGTLIGAGIGHEAVNGKRSHRHHGNATELRETCSHFDRVKYEQRIDGYQVIYSYQGRKHQIEMPYDPGKRIKMRIQVTPVI